MTVLFHHAGDDLGRRQADGQHPGGEPQGDGQRHPGGAGEHDEGGHAQAAGEAGEQPVEGEVEAAPGAVAVFRQGQGSDELPAFAGQLPEQHPVDDGEHHGQGQYQQIRVHGFLP